MQANKFRVTIGGKPVYVTSIDPNPSESKDIPRTHHIVAIDRSGSMYTSIDEAIDQAKDFIDYLRGSGDLLTVLWYSGQNSHGVIVEAANGTKDIGTILDKYRSVVGATCFSEPLETIAAIAASNAYRVDQTSITLLTDGCPVVSWSYNEELTRSLVTLSNLANQINVSAVNSIGFGNYYRRDFLQQLSDVSGHGTFVHSRSLQNFAQLFGDTVDVARGLRPSKVEVDADNSEILYLGGDVRISRRQTLALSRLNAEENRIFVISEEPSTVYTNGEIVNAKTITQKEDQERVQNFLYAYADQLYYRGERQKALDIVVNNIGDQYLADKMINAFTIDEVAEAQEALRDADLDARNRYIDGRCAPGYLPKKDAFCLIDLFNIFFEDGNVSYVPFSDNVKSYKRINRQSVDTHNVFTSDQEEVITPVRDFVWNKDLLNLSIQFSINGSVKLNPKAAERVGLDPVFKTKIFRNHTIVKDGQLNMDSAEFIVSDSVYTKLCELPKLKFEALSHYGDDGHRVVIDLRSIPIVNRTYIDGSVNLDELCAYTIETAKHEAALKVLNWVHDEIVETNGRFEKTDSFKTYTIEQIAVLSDHGISKQGWYNGVSVERAKAEDSDSYEARALSFYVKGASSLPSITDFQKMLAGTKNTNVPGKMMVDYYGFLQAQLQHAGLDDQHPTLKTVQFIDDQIKQTKKTLQMLRNQVNIIKLAKVLTNDFFHGLIPNDKGEYTYDYDDYTIVLRNDLKTIYI
ncbi:hypothetical protein P9VFCI_032 [Rhizobium phage P9VFCI]|uniref:VWFA domain-containing protein n=1 Tax=Rhizobium phage P9VFCI TaxID=2763531 RepID=A0A7G7WX40_9CAUD|nr:hypothetical protein PP937_gp032 [Rhizobium phage P9VFCI]QNH71784.1 hypothetical protein P9VFCI_032 [Rhizobium phage P9VFCI]